MSTTKNVLVIGSGVSGLTTALALLKSGHQVTVWSREAPGHFGHVSLNAYAMWVPVKLDGDARVERWTSESRPAFAALAGKPETGVELRSIYVLKQEHNEPWYAGSVKDFRHARPDELTSQYKDANVLENAPVIDPARYLTWLYSQIVAAGGKFAQQVVTNLAATPAEFDVVVNTSGLGARQLAADDTVFPDRIQVVKIKHNGFNRVVIDDDGPNKRACIVPHRDYIKLGAVFDGKHEDLAVDANHTADILARCKRMVPGFRAEPGDVIEVSRALRPEREGWLPRVEILPLAGNRQVVHNYGHDGMGYLLSHGIAAEIAGYLS